MGCFGSRPTTTDPLAVRGCTDVCWLIIYVVFWMFMIVIAIFSFVYGNPLRLVNGWDSYGNTCGVKSNDRYADLPLSGMNTIDKPYVLFMDLKHLKKSLKICVKECPSEQLNTNDELYAYYKKTNNQLCVYDHNMEWLRNDKSAIAKGSISEIYNPCPVLPVYPSKSVLNRCVPSAKTAPKEDVKNVYDVLNSLGAADQFLGDIYTTWPFIALMCAVALVLSILLIGLLHVLTTIVSWLICILVGGASICLAVVLWWTYYSTKHGKAVESKYNYLEELLKNETGLYCLAIVATIFVVFLLMIIFFMRTQLNGLAALFEEAGKCMLSLPGLFLPSILAFISLIIFFAFWVIVVVCLATASYPGENSLIPFGQSIPLNDTPTTIMPQNNSDLLNMKSLKLVEFLEAVWLKRMLWFYLIALIWTSEFIFACQQLTMAGAVAYWYFRKPFDSPVLQAMSKLVKYHLGSVAKGSFLITLFKIPRLILTYLYTKLKRSEDGGSQMAACCLKCCICWFWALEKFVRYLNHNAYTVIAIESINFCPAAGVAWNAMMSNALQVATINGIGDFVLFLGKLFVALICGLVSVLVLKNRENVNFYVAPTIIIALFAFFIAHVILSLYEIVVDTLFLCVCEDRTINGNNGRWRESKLAYLLGEDPVVEERVQSIEMAPITKEPFSSHA